MLQTENQFPYPGSIALFLGLRWRVLSHAADGTAHIAREGDAASLTRRANINELVDPKIADENAMIALTDMSEAAARIGLFIARQLRDANEVTMSDLRRQLAEASREGRIPAPRDNFQIAMLLRRLGWRKVGYVKESYGTSARYARGAVQ
ncbi:hypothetical protein BV98_000557 [Sphingobium herbicidovorans NBRC 16415]|uniref:Uncharacterized protein n=1 Tax=Sphingobium herbicidovorans (strain ATCC 700291 / DSM 11019 / CCUG 56400 / KCTC 2939 / LMG 18315 / NBRC 16415 / MH) TaxID=1219045 RepID=A0A086PE81_SPHHM|nr:hypothetical protein [Sphingobium herbicidovorans]KFG91699.1 hypothetical protein BV98_000557 [Sphingobium herbicidovorans NBRC 16415]